MKLINIRIECDTPLTITKIENVIIYILSQLSTGHTLRKSGTLILRPRLVKI